MTTQNVQANLLVRDGASSRHLNVQDFAAASTGAATEATMLELLAAIGTLTPAGTRRVTAGENLSGHRLVIPQEDETVVYASNADLADINLPIWLTTGAIITGDQGYVVYIGIISESSWNWTPGMAVYLGADGLPTQVPPTAPDAAFLIEVGLAINVTDVFFHPKVPVVLS